MRRFSSSISFFLSAVSATPAARAQAGASTSSAAADEIVVSGGRLRPLAPDPTLATSRIEAERLERARSRGEDLGTLVDRVAGARVIDLGGPVAVHALTVRGGAPSQALLVIDDVPQLSPFATGNDVGRLALESLETVELVRGGAGAVLGDGALTGALLVRTRRPTDRLHESLLLSYGERATTRIAASSALRPIAIGADFERTEGNFPYVSRSPGLPDTTEVRANNDAARGALNLRSDWTLDHSALGVSGGAFVRDAGLPGFTNHKTPTARERREGGQVRASLSTPLGDAAPGDRDASKVLLGLSAQALDIAYRDEGPGNFYRPRSSTRFWVLGTDATLTAHPFSGHLIRGHVSAGGEQSDSTEHGVKSRLRATGAVAEEARTGGLTGFVALRGEALTGQAFALLPRAGLRIEPSPELTLRLGAGRSLRTPAIDELYHPFVGGFSGNPALRSETAWEADAQASFAPIERLEIALTMFGRVISNTIIYVNHALLIRPENVGDARAAGGELEVSFSRRLGPLTTAVDLAGGLLLSELVVTGRPLPAQPRSSLGAEAVASLGPFSLSSALRYLSSTTVNLQGTLEVSPYLRWDVELAVRPVDSAVVTLSMLNVLDDRTLESIQKIPLPGRLMFVAVRVSTDPGGS